MLEGKQEITGTYMNRNNEICNNAFKLILHYRNAIMGIATIWIFVFHVWIPVFNEPAGSISLVFHNIEEYIRTVGYCGVDIFLLLSGMGLTYSIKNGTLLSFYSRRIKRVFLPYLATAFVCLLVRRWTLWEFFTNFTGVTFYTKYIHIFCWFFPAIFTLYIAFPLYYKFFSKAKSKLIFTGFSIAVWFFLSIILQDYMRADLYEFTNRIPVFLIGIYFGEVSQSKKVIAFTKKHYLCLIVAFISGLFLAYMYNFKDFELVIPGGKAVLPNILLAVSISFLTAKLMEITGRRAPQFGAKINEVLSFWGKMSLEMYCVYVSFLVPGFIIFVSVLADLKFTRLPINLVIFALTSGLSWIANIIFYYFGKLLVLPKNRKKVNNSKNEQQVITE